MGKGTVVADRARFRIWGVMGAAVAVLVLVVAFRGVWNDDGPGSTLLCRGLGSGPEGLEVIVWDNGVTQTGGSWLSALTDGVEHADGPSRRRIAVAVKSDVAGYESMVTDLSSLDRRQFDLLRRAVLNPDSQAGRQVGPGTSRALQRVRTLAVQECGLV